MSILTTLNLSTFLKKQSVNNIFSAIWERGKDMKRTILIMACILLVMSVSSCTSKKGPPPSVQFYSFEGIQEYVSMVNWKTRTYKYDSSRNSYNIYQELSYAKARKSVKDITKTVIPRVKEDVEVEDFSASYYIGYDEPFQIKYRIDGTLFVFTYSYSGEEDEYPGEPLCQGTIANQTLYLYEGRFQREVRGTVRIEKTEIYVQVYADNYNTIHFDYFDFIKLSK